MCNGRNAVPTNEKKIKGNYRNMGRNGKAFQLQR